MGSGNLEKLLGLIRSCQKKTPLETNNMLSTIILHNRLNVYSDVADYTYLCDLTAHILRFVAFETSKHSQQPHKEFFNRQYVPTGKSYIDQVHVCIKGDTGKDILFSSGKT